MIRMPDHPLLDASAFLSEFPEALGATPSPDWLQAGLALDAEAPLRSDDEVRTLVRKMLRHGGYRPTGRGKPASEYLIKAASSEEGMPSINAAVDACNVSSLHSGLPISVIDLDLASGDDFTVRLGEAEEEYVFNRSGQLIRLAGLLVLCDGEGPCANAVKDSQRTKTHEGTRRTLSIVWGSNALSGRTEATTRWYREMLERAGATTEPLTPKD